MGLSVSLGLLRPWPLKVLVDNVAGGEPLVLAGWSPSLSWEWILLGACLAHLLFHAGDSLVQVGSSAVATITSSKMIRDLRSNVLERLQRLPLQFHDAHRTGDLVHRVSFNSTCVETAFQSGFMGAAKSVIMLLGMLTVMLLMSVKMTLIALAVAPALVVTIKWYAKRTHRASLEHQNQEGRVSSLLQEILGAVRLVRAYGREDYEQKRFVDTCTDSVGTRLRSTMIQKWFGFLTAGWLALGTALLFWIGIRSVRAEELTIGGFLVFTSYLAMLYSPLSVLSYTASSVNSALGGATRLFEILDSAPDIDEKPDAESLGGFCDRLEIDGVTFGYSEGRPVLKDLSLVVRRGETVAIVGETGSGKSTLLSLMMRLQDPWKGAVRLDGRDVRDLTIDSVRGCFGYVPQDCLLLSGTVRDNIRWARPDATDAEVEDAARRALAHDYIMEREGGYDSEIGERGVQLSVGQRQRIAIARALLREAPILLLDEPTSALDSSTESRVLEKLTEHPELTLVIVAHRLATIRDADRIVVISNGEAVEEGSHEQLMEKGGAYRELWLEQANAYQRDVPLGAG